VMRLHVRYRKDRAVVYRWRWPFRKTVAVLRRGGHRTSVTLEDRASRFVAKNRR